MAQFVGLDVSQKLTAIRVVDNAGRRLWRGQCPTAPEQIEEAIRRHAGVGAAIAIETGPMTPWLVHELRGCRLEVVCIDARHARAALKMQIKKTDHSDIFVWHKIIPKPTPKRCDTWVRCALKGTRPRAIVETTYIRPGNRNEAKGLRVDDR